ncbi:MAG: hypothetical protein U5K77_00225 [Candidatus Saccharibacteria bacterium]|nr:hypothetical protein [Candidatus Saccharibacteria bacterium]
MKLRKHRWSRAYESAEEELELFLEKHNIQADRWTAEPGEAIPGEASKQDKRLWCAEGTVIYAVNGQDISLQPGDTLDIPAQMYHEAQTGLGGCICYQHSTDAKA